MPNPNGAARQASLGDTDQNSHQLHPAQRFDRRAVRSRLSPWLILVALVGAASFSSRTALADPSAGMAATVNSPDGLNLRGGPSTSYPVLAVMPGGAAVSVTGAATSDNWLPVHYNGQDGWADGVYITLGGAAAPAAASAAPAPPPPPAPTTMVVQPADGLNLRSGPGTTYNVLTVLPGGASVSITGPANDVWVPVTYNGQNGWVNNTYLGPAAPAPAAATTVSSAAGSSTGGATVSAPTSGSAPAQPTTSAPAATIQLAWPGPSRRISTVFSPAHLGIDIDEFPTSGRPLSASADGTVSFAGGETCCSYGLYVIVDHGNGVQTLYAHLSSIAVKVGQAVKQGQNLGVSGCTGRCTGPHIHFEVRINGKQVDPLRYLPPPWDIE